MIELIEISLNSIKSKINKKNSDTSFQILGYDFIIDKNFKTYILEVNDNPGLSFSSPLIEILIPRMLDDAFRLTLDKMFKANYSNDCIQNDKFKSRFPVFNYSNSENLW